MKTKSMLAAAALCIALPAAGCAQGLPEFLDAVGSGVQEGVAQSAAKIAASMEEELGLALALSDARIEDGKTLTLTVTAENPRMTETSVSFALGLPQRLACGGETAWEAVLPPAQADEDGVLAPSVTTFERTLALRPGGASESAQITCEMSMGPRFYRAQQTLDLCVPDVTVNAQMEGAENGRLEPGDPFVWRIEVCNAGTAAEDMEIVLIKPEAALLSGEAPAGFTLLGDKLKGTVRAEAAAADETGVQASTAVIELPMQIREDALEGDADATKLIGGTLYANGERVPLPRIQVCDAKISAQLIAETDALEEGEMTTLRVMVVNEGLVGADMELSCVLPAGLELLAIEETPARISPATPGEAGLPANDGDGAGPDGVPTLAAGSETQQTVTVDNNTVVYAWYMTAAEETEDGLTAATQVFELPVRATKAQEDLNEQLVGATIAYSVDNGDMRFGEPVAMRLYAPGFLGMTGEDWSGVFWAAVLMLITIGCLYGAVRAGSDKDEYYCCE